MKRFESNDRSLVGTGRDGEHSPEFRLRAKKPLVLQTVSVAERTRLPKLILATALAATLAAGAVYLVERSKLQEERRIAEERFRGPFPRAGATPEESRPSSGHAVRTPPTVRAVTAEADGRDLR